MAIDRNRLRYATEVFIAECRRQHFKLSPDKPNPVKSLEEYPPDQQAALMRALEKSLVATTPPADKFYIDWLSKRPEGQ